MNVVYIIGALPEDVSAQIISWQKASKLLSRVKYAIWLDPNSVDKELIHSKNFQGEYNEYESQAVGILISMRLKELGMTQRELADAAGITEVTTSRYINGEREPKVSTLYRIAKALKTDLNYFQDAFEIPFS